MNTTRNFDPNGDSEVELGANNLNKLVNENKSAQPIPGGKGIRISQHSSGFTVSVIKPRTLTTRTPLIIVRSTSAEKVRVTAGYINQVMPTFDGTPLDELPEIEIEADTWVWAKCVGTFGDPDSYVATIETSLDASVPAGTAISGTGFTTYYPIGNIVFEGFIITNQHSGGNLGVDSWGLINLWWRA